MAIRRDIIGLRSGKLTALAPHHTNGTRWYWTFRCDCGTEKPMRTDKVLKGEIKSCGCAQHAGGNNGGGPRGPTGPRVAWSHLLNSRTYRSWGEMIQRCTNPKCHAWEYYGATGITVCDRWKKFGAFLEDMGECPPGLTIDRWPNPHGNYEPGNCRWATMKEQAANRRQWGTVAAKKFPKNFSGKI